MKRETRNLLMFVGVLLLLGGVPSAAAAPRQLKTKRLTRAELEALARDVGFPDPAHAATIALRESGGDPRAVNDTRGVPKAQLPKGVTNEHSIGLWQINLLAHGHRYTEQELLDPRRNAEAAFEISRRGTDWSAWSTARTPTPTPMPTPGRPVPKPSRTIPTVRPPAVPGEPPGVEAQKGIEAAAAAAAAAAKGED